MKTIQTTQVKAIYDIEKRSIMFLNDGRPSHGFVGDVASSKHMECLIKGIPVEYKENNMEKTALIVQFHTILSKKGMMSIKEDILLSYGVASTKDLTVEQLQQTINQLNNSETPKHIREARSLVLTLLDKLDIKGNSEIGWHHVNSYLLNLRGVNKSLYALSYQELGDCALRLRAIIHKKKQTA
jgi:hypothetical protein